MAKIRVRIAYITGHDKNGNEKRDEANARVLEFKSRGEYEAFLVGFDAGMAGPAGVVVLSKPKAGGVCPQCGAQGYRVAMLPDQVGKGLHEAKYCKACGYEDAV